MDENLRNFDMVLDTMQECARKCGEVEGLSLIHFSCIPDNGTERNHGLVIGTPENLIITILKAMAKNDLVRRIVMTAAGSYSMFNKLAGDQIRNAK